MAIHDLFSKRRKQELGERPDVYAYDFLPHELRVQIIHCGATQLDRSTATTIHGERLRACIMQWPRP